MRSPGSSAALGPCLPGLEWVPSHAHALGFLGCLHVESPPACSCVLLAVGQCGGSMPWARCPDSRASEPWWACLLQPETAVAALQEASLLSPPHLLTCTSCVLGSVVFGSWLACLRCLSASVNI